MTREPASHRPVPQRPEPPDPALLPRDPATGEALPPTSHPGYYPGYSTLSQSAYWDKTTRGVIAKRVSDPPPRRYFTEDQWRFWQIVFDHLVPQTDRTPEFQIPVLPPLDERLFLNKTDGYRYEGMPKDREAYVVGIDAINAEAQACFNARFLDLPFLQQDQVLENLAKARPTAPKAWKHLPIRRFWQLIMSDAIRGYYAHPFAWDEVGFGGPAYPRAYTRLERGEPEPWEVEETRYEWLAPVMSVSDQAERIEPEDQHQSQSGSGGTH